MTNSEISLEKVSISWLDRVSFKGFLIKDAHLDTMIYAEDLSINYKIKDLWGGDYLAFEEILSEQIRLNLVKHDSLSKLNLTEFLQTFRKDTANKSGFSSIKVDHLSVHDLHLNLTDKTKKRYHDKVDFSHLDFYSPFVDLYAFELRSDTILGNLNHFSGYDDNSGLIVEELQSKFSISNKSLSLDDLDLRTPTSHLSDSIELFYNGLDDLAFFTDSVSFIFHFNDSRISKEDVALFTGFNQLKSDISLDGIFWGKVGDFNIEDARIGFGRYTYLKGGLSCFGLPDPAKIFILADVTDSHIVPEDFDPYIGELTENLRRMGKIDFTGSFAGFLRDFVAKGNFETDQGSVYTDINLKIPEDRSLTSYEGSLETVELNIGSFLENEIVQQINLSARVKGRGITLDNAVFSLEAIILNSGLKEYYYDTVYLKGDFEKNFFKTEIITKDPNCNVEGVAELDMRSNNEFIDLNIQVDQLDAKALNFTKHDISAHGHIDLTVENFDIDYFEGELKVDSGLLEIGENALPIESVEISSLFKEDSLRQILIGFPGVNADVSGKFKITDIIQDVSVLTERYARKLHLVDTIGLEKFESEMNSFSKLNAVIELENASIYFDSLKIPIKPSPGSQIEFAYRGGEFSNLSLFYSGDSLTLYGSKFVNPVFEANSSSDSQFEKILTNFIFGSSSQKFSGIPETNDLLLEGVWFGDRIEFSSLIEQASSASDVRIESLLTLAKDSIVFKVLPSDIVILDDQWTFSPINSIVFDSEGMTIHNMELYDQSESVRLSGQVSKGDSTQVKVIVEDLNMDKANLFAANNVEGFLNGDFDLFRENSDQLMKFAGEFFLKNFKYDEVRIGDLNGSSKWDPVTKSIFSTIEVIRDDFKSIDVNGYYYPNSIDDQLDFEITFDQADLSLAKPFTDQNFSDMHGTATGQAKLTGSIKKPFLKGGFSLNDGGGRVNYLNTEYSFSGDVNFDLDQIIVPNIRLSDRKGESAYLSGIINHKGFKDFRMDLSITAENFEFLNTTSLDNSLYYGDAYGTGTIKITGPLNDIVVKANVTSAPNTRVFIPISESSSSSQEDFIQFVSLNDSTVRLDQNSGSTIKGITLDFDMEVTPDAYCELIFDIKKGDIIRGRGRGNLKLLLNTDGEFTMFGPLQITSGAYNFTLSNLINKEFAVEPGGRIVWYGDPYDASLDLEATYLQRASFEELKNPEDRDDAELANKVPLLAVLDIEGSMLAPGINFDIRLQDESDATNENEGELSAMDEDELRRQFISLLFLKRFTPKDGFFTGSTGLDVSGSVSEILSNQVSYLISQIDENLEVEVDLAALDEEAFNTFQLRFAYTFLDGRLRVTRGGSFGGTDQQQEQNVLNNIVGDWSVEYSLTKDGRLRAKVFQNTNERLINVNNGSFSQETGISLRFVHSFNDFKELMTSSRQEALRRRREEEESEQLGNNSDLNSRID